MVTSQPGIILVISSLLNQLFEQSTKDAVDCFAAPPNVIELPDDDEDVALSDFGFRQTLEGRTLGCAQRFRLLPTCTPPPC